MKSALAVLLISSAWCGSAWTIGQKFGIYAMVQRLPRYQTSSQPERDVYVKVSMFLGNFKNAAALYKGVGTADYQNALFTLLTDVNAARSDAIDDPSGVLNMDYLVGRIRTSYLASVHAMFS
ncbi:hypothetical protein GQ54DRAFT_311999 [Martensiomyces pterosporus]|nr:hypothetical protein GQ54DRAFT_311999 [Martensiomyces pterosporus]